MPQSGKLGEELVAHHYKKLGFSILDTNYIFHKGKQMGELDLVARKDREIVFVEVKTRGSTAFGDAFSAVNSSKQRKLVHMAKLYMAVHPQYRGFDFRIDVAAVDIDNKANPVIILTNVIEDLD